MYVVGWCSIRTREMSAVIWWWKTWIRISINHSLHHSLASGIQSCRFLIIDLACRPDIEHYMIIFHSICVRLPWILHVMGSVWIPDTLQMSMSIFLLVQKYQYILLHQKDTIHIREYMAHHPYDHVLPFYKSQVSQWQPWQWRWDNNETLIEDHHISALIHSASIRLHARDIYQGQYGQSKTDMIYRRGGIVVD